MTMKIPAPALLLSALSLLTGLLTDAAAKEGAVDHPRKTAALPTGIDMQYVEAGNHEGNEIIILLHGYTDSSRSFYPTVEALLALDRDLHIYIPDLRGHGGSSMPDGAACAAAPRACFRMADFARDLLAFMDLEDIPGVFREPLPRVSLDNLPDEGAWLQPLRPLSALLASR